MFTDWGSNVLVVSVSMTFLSLLRDGPYSTVHPSMQSFSDSGVSVFKGAALAQGCQSALEQDALFLVVKLNVCLNG